MGLKFTWIMLISRIIEKHLVTERKYYVLYERVMPLFPLLLDQFNIVQGRLVSFIKSIETENAVLLCYSKIRAKIKSGSQISVLKFNWHNNCSSINKLKGHKSCCRLLGNPISPKCFRKSGSPIFFMQCNNFSQDCLQFSICHLHLTIYLQMIGRGFTMPDFVFFHQGGDQI